jgi:hypothetical protein
VRNDPSETATNPEAPVDPGFPEQPWNVKRAYQATRILDDAWRQNVETLNDDLRMRYFEAEFDKAEKREIPVAIDIVKKARFFLLLLDEDVPAAKAESDAGLMVSDLTLVPHPLRVVLVDLKLKSFVFRARVTAGGDARMATGEAIGEAMQKSVTRQVNNCGAAQRALEALHAK